MKLYTSHDLFMHKVSNYAWVLTHLGLARYVTNEMGLTCVREVPPCAWSGKKDSTKCVIE